MALTLLNKPLPLHLDKTPAFWKIQSDQFSQPNHRIEAELSSSHTYGVDSLVPDEMGTVTFELSEYLLPLSQPAFTFPDINVPYSYMHACELYQVTFKEYYGSPPVLADTLVVNHQYVLHGEIPEYLHNSFYKSNSSFFSWLIDEYPCLTLWPKKRTLYDSGQTEKLFFCITWHLELEDQWDAQLMLNLKFTDGSSAEVLHPKIATPRFQFTILEFHVGYDALDMASIMANYPNKVLSSYEIKVAFNGAAGSTAVYEYILAFDNHFANKRQFIFRNSVGGYDTFIATGTSETESEYENELVSVAPWLGWPGNLKKIWRTNFKETIKCNSGFLSKELMSALPQFFLSDDVYEIIDNHIYPIAFVDQSIVRKTDKRGLSSVQFEYMHLQISAIETIEVT